MLNESNGSNSKIRVKMQVIKAGVIWHNADIPIIDHPSAFFVCNQDPRVAEQFHMMSMEMKLVIETYTVLISFSVVYFLVIITINQQIQLCSYKIRLLVIFVWLVLVKIKIGIELEWFLYIVVCITEEQFSKYKQYLTLDESILIVFIDYGNSETKPANEIYPMQESLARLPAMTVACTLADVSFCFSLNKLSILYYRFRSHFHTMRIFGRQKRRRYSIFLSKIVLLKFIFNKAVVNNGKYRFLLFEFSISLCLGHFILSKLCSMVRQVFTSIFEIRLTSIFYSLVDHSTSEICITYNPSSK
jgi:hypothetical protein